MSVLKDLRDEIANYATEQVETSIWGFEITGGTHSTPHSNPGDVTEFSFNIRVKNQGELVMKNVIIQVFGSEHAEVALPGSNFVPILRIPHFDLYPLEWRLIYGGFSTIEGSRLRYPGREINPHHFLTNNIQDIACKGRVIADNPTSGDELIVFAKILSWDAGLEHILNFHSIEGAPEGELIKTIIQD